MSKEIASNEQAIHWARQLNGGKPTYGQLVEQLTAANERAEKLQARIDESQNPVAWMVELPESSRHIKNDICFYYKED